MKSAGPVMHQLATSFNKLDEFFRTEIHKPAENKGGINHLVAWNKYFAIKRHIKLCVIHIVEGKQEFDWEWLHKSGVLLETDYKIFPELEEFAKQGPIKTVAQALTDRAVALREEAAKLTMLAQERAKQESVKN